MATGPAPKQVDQSGEWETVNSSDEWETVPATSANVGPAAPPVSGDWRDKFTTPTQHNLKSLLPGKNGQFNAGAYAHEAGTALSNIGAGGLGAILHPINTAVGIG